MQFASLAIKCFKPRISLVHSSERATVNAVKSADSFTSGEKRKSTTEERTLLNDTDSRRRWTSRHHSYDWSGTFLLVYRSGFLSERGRWRRRMRRFCSKCQSITYSMKTPPCCRRCQGHFCSVCGKRISGKKFCLLCWAWRGSLADFKCVESE